MNDVNRRMIEAQIRNRFPAEDQQGNALRLVLTSACNQFVDQGLADPKFISELASGEKQKFWSCISEALVADRLQGKTFSARTNRGTGPDFLVMDGNRKVWIEVVCPEPIGVPDTWLDSQPGVASDVPHKEILLRWTSAIRAKAVKLVGSADGSVKGYLQTKVVGPHDAYVIAVNGCQLRNGAISAHLGISHFPVAAEAVFPIGPYQLKIDKDSLEVVERGHQSRPYLKNANAAQVPLYMFLDPRFIPVSAIWAVDLDGSSAIGNAEPTSVIHNPNATSRVSLGYLPADEEYEATSTGSEELTLNKI